MPSEKLHSIWITTGGLPSKLFRCSLSGKQCINFRMTTVRIFGHLTLIRINVAAYSFWTAAMFRRNFYGKLNMQIRIVDGNIKCMEIVFWPSNFFSSGPSSVESEKSPVSMKRFFNSVGMSYNVFFSSLDWLTISSFKLFDAQMNDRTTRFGRTNRSTNATEPQHRMWKQSLTI